MITLPEINWAGIMPALVLSVTGVVVLLVGLFVRRGSLATATAISLMGIAVAFVTNIPLRYLKQEAFSGLVVMDAFCWFVNILILVAAGLTILISMRYLADEELVLRTHVIAETAGERGHFFRP